MRLYVKGRLPDGEMTTDHTSRHNRWPSFCSHDYFIKPPPLLPEDPFQYDYSGKDDNGYYEPYSLTLSDLAVFNSFLLEGKEADRFLDEIGQGKHGYRSRSRVMVGRIDNGKLLVRLIPWLWNDASFVFSVLVGYSAKTERFYYLLVNHE